MKKYIVLLRGINVSGKNKIPMIDLRILLSDLDFKNVQTYIQTGNIILESSLEKELTICKIKNGIKDKFGLNISVLVKTVKELEIIFNNYPFPKENEKILAFTFLDKVPQFFSIDINTIDKDKYSIVEDVVYLYCPMSFSKTKLTNNTIEKKLKVTATTRNFKTTRKLLELAI